MTTLRDIFTAVAYKNLSQVDLPDLGSNQHEVNGVATLREFFRTTETLRGQIAWHYFADDEEPTSDIGEFTFYDARARSADRTGRSEWRFYYTGQFLDRATPGDALVFGKTEKGDVFGLVFEQGSSWFRAANVLFGLDATHELFQLLPDEMLSSRELELQRQLILEELGLDLSIPPEPEDEDLVIQRFGMSFPPTRAMSEFARSLVDVDITNGDLALTEWIAREEKLFRALERIIVGERLRTPFTDVDEFISFSLSVHNRRKSRMGNALQNHLESLFLANGLRFSKQARTEGKNRPDFLFPSEDEYHNPQYDVNLLMMLGAKSTAKERWRQILTEADRIPDKHLCTLEAGISAAQTREMQRHRVTLVVPETLRSSYTEEQARDILTVNGFINIVRLKQGI